MAIEQLREDRCSWLTASEDSVPSELASGDEVELCCSGEQGVVGTESTRLSSPPAFCFIHGWTVPDILSTDLFNQVGSHMPIISRSVLTQKCAFY